MAASSPFPGPLCVIQLLLLLLEILGAAAQKLEVLQSQGPVSVSVGQTLTLNCMLRGDPVPGGVRWHKGSDRQQPPIYSQKQPFPRRVIRVIPESNTDFTIRITDIRPEDAGTYFCVKYRLRVTGESEQASGAGTEVSVIATPSQPVITAPSGRVAPGSTVAFNCSTGGFYPRDITVTWFKGSSEIKASDTDTVVLPLGDNITYQVWSTVKVQLCREDLMTQLLCRITHKAVVGTLEQSFRLADVLRDQCLLSTLGLIIGLVLGKTVAAAFLFYLFLKNHTGHMGSGAHSHAPPAQSIPGPF
ncbi:signal-regulatory protein beta-1-like [Varanus komodoensis]|uniref:signal-regulatory protein beta-1-like n=1 Tax=Varanus komodoensis TaxID=61221 RepID=UPI001CF7A780|nr:signal-regulatory protein beta-1-like [Varanus komodoensis]